MEISPQHTYLRHLFHLCAIVLSTSISPTEGAYHWDYLITWSIRRRVSEKSFVICPKRVLFRLVVMEIRWRDRNMNERVCKINTASVRSSPDNKLPSDSASDWVIGAGRLNFFSVLHCWIAVSSNSINNMSTALVILILETVPMQSSVIWSQRYTYYPLCLSGWIIKSIFNESLITRTNTENIHPEWWRRDGSSSAIFHDFCKILVSLESSNEVYLMVSWRYGEIKTGREFEFHYQ